MNRCVNINHPEFKELLNQSELDPISLAADISIWQDRNDTDLFPTLNQLNGRSEVQYQKPTDEGIVASEKTIRDLTASVADRIGMPYRIISDRDQKFKGKIEGNTAIVNLAYATLDTPIHEILGHPIIRILKGTPELRVGDKVTYSTILGDKTSTIKTFSKVTGLAELEDGSELQGYELTKIQSPLYNNLLKELEYGRGKEVLDRIKRDYTYKYGDKEDALDEKWSSVNSNRPKYTLEEQQEEAIVELLGMMTAERLDAVKDGKLISLLKRLLKEIKAFVKNLLRQREVEIDKLPDNMTIGDLADLLAYSNSKLILPGNEVVYTTPDNQTFKTYAEASNHISELAKNVQDVDLNNVSIQGKKVKKAEDIVVDSFEIREDDGIRYYRKIKGSWYEVQKNIPEFPEDTLEDFFFIGKDQIVKIFNSADSDYQVRVDNSTSDFISKNKEYEQSKEIIEEWMRVNNIRYNPEEIYSRGQEFVSIVGAYSSFDVNLMMQNLLQHIEDNQKAGGEFAVSAITKPVDRKLGHLEGSGGKIRFKIYPQPHDILWAANADVYSGSVWDAGEKINKDKKSELLGVTYSKYPALNNLSSIKPNLAEIVDDLDHHHNELGIALTGSNFRLDYDEDIPYQTKKIIDSINRILDQKYGKLRKPKIEPKSKVPKFLTSELEKAKENLKDLLRVKATNDFSYLEPYYVKQLDDAIREAEEQVKSLELEMDRGFVQPKITSKDLKESINNVKNRLDTREKVLPESFVVRNRYTSYSSDTWFYKEGGDWYIKYVPYDEPLDYPSDDYNKLSDIGLGIDEAWESYLSTNPDGIEDIIVKERSYTEQALVNTKVAKLKEVAKKYPRALIRSEVRPIQNTDYSSSSDLFDDDFDLPFQKVPSVKTTGQVLRDGIFKGESSAKSSTILGRIAKSTHPLSKLASKLLEYVKYNDVDITIEDRDNTITTKDGNSFSVAGAYYSATNSITLFENAKYPESRLIGLILHEILHSLSYHQLRKASIAGKDFSKLLEHAKKHLPDQYALRNTDEFLVALFTNAEFIRSLENVPPVEGKFRNFFEEVFDWLLKLLKLNKPDFYSQAFSVATNILEDFKTLNEQAPIPTEVLGEREIKPDDNKLKSLLERTGFNLVTLAEYEKLKGKKFNVNALVDMTARLVAMADGASTSALTEELAHIAVAQSRGTTEYNTAMKLLDQTDEYAQFYDQYMQEYENDQYVREEILGKILMSDLEMKLGNSIGMWLRRLWNKFLSIFRNNDLRSYVSRITDEFIANPDRAVKGEGVFFQLGEEEKTLQQQVNKLNRRYKDLAKRQKSNPTLLAQIRALEEELEGTNNGLGIYKFLKLLNADTKNAIDFIKDYFTITEKEGRAFLGSRKSKEAPSNNKTMQLAKYIGYYLPFLKELNMILDEDSVISIERKKILDKMIRIHTENFEVINRAYNQFLRENNNESTEAKELDIAGQRIMTLNELREAPRDSNFLETWFGLARNNSDTLVRLAHRTISDIKNKIRRAVLNWSDDFLSNAIDYIGKDMSWVAERVTVDVVNKKTGEVTTKVQKSGNFIDEVHQGQWELAREQFHTSLHERYGFSQDFAERLKQKKTIQGYGEGVDAFQKSEIQKLKEYNKEIAQWYTANSVPNPKKDEIIAERKAALSPEQFEFWKMRNMETNLDGSVKYHKGELVSPSRGKTKTLEFGNQVKKIKTTDWTNKDYAKLSDKDRTFLQYLKDQKKVIDKSIPFADSNRLPQMYESTLDIMRLNEPEVFKRLGKNIKSSIVREEDDTQFVDTVQLNDGTILDDVPIRFTSLLSEPDRVTTDILSSLIAYKQMQENYVQMSAQLPMFENWLQGAKRRVVKSGNKVIRGEDSWSFDALRKFLEVHVSGKEKEDLSVNILGTQVSITKAVEKLSQWVRMKNLGFNFITMTSNLLSAKVFATVESLVGNYTNPKSSAFANKEFFSILPTVISSFNGVRSTDRISSLMTYFGLGRDIREMFDDLDKHVLMRNQPDKTLMYGYEKGDYFTKSVVMIAILDNYRVHDNKWYTRREADKAGLNFDTMTSAYNMLKTDKDGKVNHSIPESVIDNLTARMRTIATRVDGSLSPEDKGAIYQHAVFNMVGLHRGWLFEGLSRRLKSKGYDFTLNQVTEGEYRTVMDLIGRFFMSPKKLRSIQEYLAKYNELEDYQKENLKRVMLELSMIAAFTIIALALNSGDDDDEDYFRDLLAYQSNRLLLEVSSFYNPNEFVSAIKDPIVPARDLELVTNFTDMFNTKEIESGKWEGMTKQQKYFLQLVPGIKGFSVMRDPEGQNDFLKHKPLKPIYSAYEFFTSEEEK